VENDLAPASEGYLMCQNGLTLSVKNNKDKSNQWVNLTPADHEKGQHWYFDGPTISGGYRRLRNGHNHYLTVKDDYKGDDGYIVVLEAKEDWDGQWWRFEKD
jgi:hypothetical protein